MIYPSFFVGGSQKCGTSSLALWLNEHPLLLCSSPKEPKFFSNQSLIKRKGDYKDYFPLDREENVLLFEASTSTMNDGIAIDRISTILGKSIKFIFILRDPVERSLSAYYHMLKHFSERRGLVNVFGGIPEKTEDLYEFENKRLLKALECKDVDISSYKNRYDNPLWPYRYLYNSLYSVHIKRFQEKFGAQNILVLSLDNIRTESEVSFKKITDFLDIQPYSVIPDTTLRNNVTSIPSYLLVPSIRNSNVLLLSFRFFDRCLGHTFARTLLRTKTPKPQKELIEKLHRLFQKEFELLGSI